MMCIVCHQGMKFTEYPKFGEPYWNDARLRFIAEHQRHNPNWAHGWKNSVSRAVLIAWKYGNREEGDALRKRFVEVFHEDINRNLKVV